MSHNNHKVIGICLTMINGDLQSQFVHAAIKRANEYGCKVIIYSAFSDLYLQNDYDTGEAKIFDQIRYDILDGLIILSETIKDPSVLNSIVRKAKEHNIYTVSVDKHIEDCYNIQYNYRNAFESIVRHVIEKHNCKTINLVAGFANNEFSDERIACCRKVMEGHGLTLDTKRIMYGDFWRDPTEKAFDEFMKSGMSMPDAFICCNDTMAITICAKLKEYGYAIPDDVIVTGFDGIEEEKYNIPRLTTASQDISLAGEKAVDAIISNLNSRTSDNFCIIDHKPVWSHSCGCQPIDYQAATGKIMPLFKMTDEDNSFDTYMFEFAGAASSSKGINELSKVLHQYSSPYCWHYFAVNLNEDFMNISDTYESFIKFQSDDEVTAKRLIISESYRGNNFEPYYSEKCRHFYEAFEDINVFLFWPIHFQEKNIGYGIMGLGTGCDHVYPNDDFRHIIKYTRQINHILQIVNSQSVMTKVIAKLQDLYIRDHTGLYNRRGFYTEISKYISKANETPDKDTYLIIISIDMDDLKLINDTYGHSEGDEALKAIAQALISIWGVDEICSRFGGDEFTVASICTDDPKQKGEELIGTIRSYLDNYNETSGKPYKVKSSFGLHYDKIGADFVVDNLIKIADDLMYHEKSKHKKGRVRSSSRNN